MRQRFTIIQTSNFNGLNRFRREGPQAMRPILEQRRDVGFNALRDWTAFSIPLIGVSPPTDDLYDAIPDYFGFASEYGFYIELTAFTGPYPYFPNEAAFLRHWDRLDRAVEGLTNLLDLEAVNEGDNGPNLGVPLDKLKRPTNKLASHGSAVQDAPPMEPVWDVAQHRPGSNEEQRKVGHNAMADVADVYGVPAWCNETKRRPDNDSDLNHAYDAAAGAALLCAGSCFHSPGGKNATIWTGLELELAKAWTAGARSVPLEFQDGRYVHRTDLENEQILRAYSRVLSDGREYVVRIRV